MELNLDQYSNILKIILSDDKIKFMTSK